MRRWSRRTGLHTGGADSWKVGGAVVGGRLTTEKGVNRVIILMIPSGRELAGHRIYVCMGGGGRKAGQSDEINDDCGEHCGLRGGRRKTQ
jgi:hypothetical protein